MGDTGSGRVVVIQRIENGLTVIRTAMRRIRVGSSRRVKTSVRDGHLVRRIRVSIAGTIGGVALQPCDGIIN